MTKRSPTTKSVDLLKQLHDLGQLTLATEFQRNSVWPRAAKAYLIDTILNDRPIPPLFLQRVASAQTSRTGYAVIDGQQRLRAIFDFLEDRIRLSQSDKKMPFYNKTFSQLKSELRDKVLNYDLPVQELSGYTDEDIEDVFVRMNKYVVKLSPQEMRHARGQGKFHEFAERLGRWDFWITNRIVTAHQARRMRAVEFAAELVILLIEGPQDKKSVIDLYYREYQRNFAKGKRIEALLKQYLDWIETALPDLPTLRYRSPTDFYSLVGALDELSAEGKKLKQLPASKSGDALREFATEVMSDEPRGDAARYLAAASRQTDNIQPRTTRIEILRSVLSGA